MTDVKIIQICITHLKWPVRVSSFVSEAHSSPIVMGRGRQCDQQQLKQKHLCGSHDAPNCWDWTAASLYTVIKQQPARNYSQFQYRAGMWTMFQNNRPATKPVSLNEQRSLKKQRIILWRVKMKPEYFQGIETQPNHRTWIYLIEFNFILVYVHLFYTV